MTRVHKLEGGGSGIELRLLLGCVGGGEGIHDPTCGHSNVSKVKAHRAV